MAYPMLSSIQSAVVDPDEERAAPVVAALPLSGADGPAGGDAAAAVRSVLDDQLLDQMVAKMRADGVRLSGPGGFLTEMLKAVLERGLATELTEHLGYDRNDPAGRNSGNSRNGSTPKTVLTEVGPVALDIPRDRAGTFTPTLVPKGERRLGGLSDIIISLYAGGMTVRDICHHLQRVYGTELSADTVSAVTDSVLEEVKAWQTRPLDEA
jgi:putative transposase